MSVKSLLSGFSNYLCTLYKAPSRVKSTHQKINSIDDRLVKISDDVFTLSNTFIRNLPRSMFFKHSMTTYNEFNEAFQRPDFKDRYVALIKGLDENSIATVSSVLSRLRMCIDNPEHYWDIYTNEEKHIYQDIHDKLFSRIVKLSDDVYAYKQYLLPRNTFDSGVFYYKYGLEYVAGISKTKDKDIIDAGAYIGDSVLLFSQYTSKKVYSFEAVSKNFEDLLKTIELNNITNAHPEQIALGEAQGELVLRGRLDSLMAATSKEIGRYIPDLSKAHWEFEEAVPMQSLDIYAAENNLDVGLIKIDVEGGEIPLLKGAFNTIKTKRPILLVSIYHYPNDFFDIKPMIESWNLGYKFKIVPGSPFLLSGLLLIAEVHD